MRLYRCVCIGNIHIEQTRRFVTQDSLEIHVNIHLTIHMFFMGCWWWNSQVALLVTFTSTFSLYTWPNTTHIVYMCFLGESALEWFIRAGSFDFLPKMELYDWLKAGAWNAQGVHVIFTEHILTVLVHIPPWWQMQECRPWRNRVLTALRHQAQDL